MAVLGVLKPNPTSLYHLRPPFPTLRLAERVFWAVKMWGCFWKARSDWTVSSVAIVASRRVVVTGRGDEGIRWGARRCWSIVVIVEFAQPRAVWGVATVGFVGFA
jgi:hypothetical protein